MARDGQVVGLRRSWRVKFIYPIPIGAAFGASHKRNTRNGSFRDTSPAACHTWISRSHSPASLNVCIGFDRVFPVRCIGILISP